jgi:hypothetical protein
MRRSLALLSIAAATLAACAAQDDDFPSLAPRPIEKTSETAPARPAPVATPDAALDARIATLARQLADAGAAFAPAVDRTRSLVEAARNAGVGSGPWLDAQTALAELDGIRAQSTAAMSTLDELAIARAAELAPPYPALDALHDKGGAQAAAESATIAALQKDLPGN